MKGRIFGLKKSSLLKTAFALSVILFCLSTIFFIFFSSFKDLWFFAFLIEAGICVFLRGAFLNIDSSFYFGSVMCNLGIFYFYAFFIKITYIYPSFILLSLAFSSLVSFAFFNNKLHAKSSTFFLFSSLFTFFFQINILPLAFFVAIICFSVLIFILSTLC